MSRYLKKKEKRQSPRIGWPVFAASSGVTLITNAMITAWAEEDKAARRTRELGGVMVPYRVRS